MMDVCPRRKRDGWAGHPERGALANVHHRTMEKKIKGCGGAGKNKRVPTISESEAMEGQVARRKKILSTCRHIRLLNPSTQSIYSIRLLNPSTQRLQYAPSLRSCSLRLRPGMYLQLVSTACVNRQEWRRFPNVRRSRDSPVLTARRDMRCQDTAQACCR